LIRRGTAYPQQHRGRLLMAAEQKLSAISAVNSPWQDALHHSGCLR
jgi:hypothetical protein